MTLLSISPQTPWELPSLTGTAGERTGISLDWLHLNGRGKRRLGQLQAKVSAADVGGSAGREK
jgi:hypothetical protein